MLAGISARDIALLLRGASAGANGSSRGASLNVMEWRKATSSHGFGEHEKVSMSVVVVAHVVYHH